MQRRLELDAARGLMLVWITFTHLPTVLSIYFNQPFGFVSAAEGFIFLSALFTGRIYCRLAMRSGYPAMRLRLALRTFRLYGYHVLMLIFAFTVAVQIAQRGNRPGLHNLLDYYFAVGAPHAVSNAFLLIYRPPLLDILPMYILFLVLTIAVLSAAERVPWNVIVGASFAFWVLAQFNFRVLLDGWLTRMFGPHIPLNQLGAFDLWAWQFQWVIGVWLGVRWAKDDLPIEKWARKVTIPAAIIVPTLLALRYMVGHGVELGAWEIHFDKWHLGVVRLIDFAAIATLLIRCQSVLKRVAIRPLVMLGQASLQVFCAHLLCCFVGLTLLGNAAMMSGPKQFALVITTLSTMFIAARIFSKDDMPTAPGAAAASDSRVAAPRPAAA